MSDLMNGQLWLGEFEESLRQQLAELEEKRVVARIWAQDASLWSHDEGMQQKILNRLGWLSSPLTMLARREELECVRQVPFQDVVLLGMGGSSLAPEMFQRIFGNLPAAPRLHVLDNTTASAVRGLQDRLDLSQTLFILASKSGTTIETRSFGDYFYEQCGRAGGQFIAITDPGSELVSEARKRGYAALFLNPQDIGGRYSALSFFGLVPAALIGLDVGRLLEGAAEEIRATSAAVPAEQNQALILGTAMALLAAGGRDKLTFLSSPTLEAFGDWAEQLVAESTGKAGRGILPVVGERIATPDAYGGDRFFVYLRLEGEGEQDAYVEALKSAGLPLLQVDLKDPYELGAQLFRWEFATAVAGAVLGINPFDEPNVTESKNNTKRLLQQFQDEGALPEVTAELVTDEIRMSGMIETESSPELALVEFVDDVIEGDYVAVMAYLPMTAANEAALRDLQAAIRDRTRAAVTVGFGPRFLHSTGQLHKGGPAAGRFIQIVAQDEERLSIPGAPYDFDTLAAAQALGDLEALQRRDFPTLRIELRGEPAELIARLAGAVSV